MDINRIVTFQRQFFQTESTYNIEWRIEQLMRLYRAIKLYEKEISHALKLDLNKSEPEAYMTEIGLCYTEIRLMVKRLNQWVKPKKVRTPLTHQRGRSYIRWEPYGVVLIISPWNYPFQLSILPLIGALAAGNTAVIKPSEFAPNTAEILKKIIKETFEVGYVTVVEGDYTVGQQLLDERFDYIFFTGSPRVGKIVMKKASEHLTPVTLELGGKSPAIITEDANLELAAKRIVFGKFTNAGQTCVAPDYCIVAESVKDAFIDEVIRYIEQFYGQDPISNDHYPRIINEHHYARLTEYLKHKNILYGGNRNHSTLKLAPTLLTDLPEDDPLMQEEIFGPILPIQGYVSIENVIQYLKAKEKPLALYLFTNDREIEEEILGRVSFGGGCVNDTLMHVAHSNLPFGGVGQSGMGQYHGKASFECFSHQKAIYKKGKGDVSFRYPPYTSSKLSWIKRLIK